MLLETIHVDIYEDNILAMFTGLGPAEASLLYFGLGVIVSYGVIKAIPAISKAYMQTYLTLLKL